MRCVGVGREVEGVAEDGRGVPVGKVKEEEGYALLEGGYALGCEQELNCAGISWARGCRGGRDGCLLVLVLYLLDGRAWLEGL